MRNAKIKVMVKDNEVASFAPYLITKGYDQVVVRLDCGSEFTFDERTLKRALAVIETDRKQMEGKS